MLVYALRLPEATYLIDDVNVDDELSRADNIYIDTNLSGEIDEGDEKISISRFQKTLAPYGVHRVRGVSLFALCLYVSKRREFLEHIKAGQVENLFEEAVEIYGLGLTAKVPKREIIKFVMGVDAKEIYFENVTARVDYICAQIRSGRDAELESYYKGIVAIIDDCERWYGSNKVLGERAVEAVNEQIAGAYVDGAAMLMKRVAGLTKPYAEVIDAEGHVQRDPVAEADFRRRKLFEKRVLIKSAMMFRFNSQNWAGVGNVVYDELKFWDDQTATQKLFETAITMVRSSLSASELEVALIQLQIISERFAESDRVLQVRIDSLTRELILKTRDAAIAAIYAGDEDTARVLETILTEDVYGIDGVSSKSWMLPAVSEVAVHKKIAEFNQVTAPTPENRGAFVASLESDLPTLEKPAIDFALKKIADSEAQVVLQNKVFLVFQTPVENSGGDEVEKKTLRPYELPL